MLARTTSLPVKAEKRLKCGFRTTLLTKETICALCSLNLCTCMQCLCRSYWPHCSREIRNLCWDSKSYHDFTKLAKGYEYGGY